MYNAYENFCCLLFLLYFGFVFIFFVRKYMSSPERDSKRGSGSKHCLIEHRNVIFFKCFFIYIQLRKYQLYTDILITSFFRLFSRMKEMWWSHHNPFSSISQPCWNFEHACAYAQYVFNAPGPGFKSYSLPCGIWLP